MKGLTVGKLKFNSLLLVFAASLFFTGCASSREKSMTLSEPSLAFEKSIIAAGLSNIETGYIENNLFGTFGESLDENGIRNRKIKVFFFLKKANRENAPYLIFLNGGPGFAITDMFLPNRYDSFLPDYNVVFFDQRGNGLSERPTNEVAELRYFSAKYIVNDAEKIRERLLGPGSQWIVFGQSYGGVVARKYIEYAPSSIKRVITHGSAKYNAVEEAIAMEIATLSRSNAYFSKYPEDKEKIEKIKKELSDADQIQSASFSVKNQGIVHILAVLFSIKSDEDFHKFVQGIDSSNLKQSYLTAISPFAQLILKGGLVSQAVGQIDLVGNLVGDELTNEIKRTLNTRKIDYQKSVFSKLRFDESVTPISADFKKLEGLFKERKITTDAVDLDKTIEITNRMALKLDAFGGEEDTLALQAIKNEESYVLTKKAKNISYHYTKGHHREWLTNSQIFKGVL